MATITLYDLARRVQPNQCWSYNVWKTRMALNYKGIPYTTAWVNHVTLRPTLESIGIPPNTSNQGFEYSVPTIQLSDGSALTESSLIAAKLEEIQPSPSLHLDAALQAEADKVVRMACFPLYARYMPLVAREIIDESTLPAFEKTREARFGMTLQEMEAKAGDGIWDAAEPGFVAAGKLLSEHKVDEGPFILGSQVCYADFILVAMFEAFKRADQGMFERAIGRNAAFQALYDACQEWVQNAQ
ncbi:glutathione s-transferase [Penicillium chermesinum]|uniref:Glutathione s-transferase n=1 Tax=Penicillium chermesinum TaxID=63820 RepID=A0A9W9TD57_9EURO|nr:glutathione s-transferase [Penicillium chermesinum]KAJ5217235.1 glutathione s-transferase [Penicillium chermesinum]KAJ6171149.1 glutathione s-transferase [Penicillium chermesinum]